MFKSRIQIGERILAWMMVFVMIFTNIPANVYASAEGFENQYTITVTDSESNPVNQAKVTYTIAIDGVDSPLEGELYTNVNGIVGIDLATDYSDKISESTPATLNYTVEKEGYNSKGKSNFSITDVAGGDTFTLTAQAVVETYTVTVNAGVGGTVKLNGTETTTLTDVAKDSKVQLTVEPEADYLIQSIEINDVAETISNPSSYERDDITITGDTVINVTFVSTLYKLVIKDGETPVEGALVKYNFVKALEDDSYESLVSDEAGVVTLADGTVTVDLSAYTTEIEAGEVFLAYAVTKDGYVTAEVTEEDAIAVAAYNGETVIPFNQIQMHTVTINVEGNGTVAIDGSTVDTSTGTYSTDIADGSYIELMIKIAEGTVLDFVRVEGNELVVDEGIEERTYTATLEITEDRTVDIAIANVYTIDVTSNEETLGADAGTITLNTEETDTIEVKEGSDVSVSVTAKNGYLIKSVLVGNEEKVTDGNVSDLTVPLEDINSDKTITVEFVKVYTITITHNGGDGEAAIGTVEPDTAGGSIIVEAGAADTTITAVPKTNYRVASVMINNENVETIKGENDEGFTTALSSNDDYVVVITFALNRYSVVAETAEDQKGTITFDETVVEGLVNHGTSTVVTVTPDAGYAVTDVTVNDGEVIYNYENGSVIFTIENITENQKVIATFAEIEKAPADSIKFNSDDNIRKIDASRTYIYANNKTVTFELTDAVNMQGILVYGLIDNVETVLGGAEDITSVELTESTVITRVEAFYKADTELYATWHGVDGIKVDSPINIVIDKELTEDAIQLVFDDKHAGEYYNHSFEVEVTATDSNEYSGIAEVRYWTVSDGVKSSETAIYTWEDGKDIKGTVIENALITVDDNKNNSESVVVWVKVTDRAGNSVTKDATPVRVNCTLPELVSIEMTGEQHAEAKDGYYTKRTATITIKDRPESFNEANAKSGIVINVEDAPNTVSIPTMISDWQPVEGSEGTYKAIITFTEDAKYTWSFNYTNEAGKELVTANATIAGGNVNEFVVDNTDPTAEIKTEGNVWSELLSKLTFGIWKNYDVIVTAEANDTTAGINTVLYYKKAGVETLLTETELDSLYGNNNEYGEFTEEAYTVSANNSSEKFVVYARISDNAGNYKYVSTDGIIVEDLKGSISFAGTDEANTNGLYNSDVNVKVAVTENENVSSGIKKIEYKIYKNVKVNEAGEFVSGDLTKQETLYNFEVTDDSELDYESLLKSWNGNITVDGKANNSDHVLVVVTVTDNAGNSYENSIPLAINTDEIKAEISYLPTAKNPNNNVPYKTVDGRGYFGVDERVATIKVTDRGTSFDEEVATAGISIAATNSKQAPEDNIIELVAGTDYEISTWTSSVNNETKETIHTATVTFKTDGNYTWSFSYENLAGNSLDVERNLSTGDSVTPFTFTVDKGVPTGSISLNENIWTTLLRVITFGLYSKEKVEVTATYEDTISPVIVEYYKTDATTALNAEELMNCTFSTYEDFTIDTENNDERFVVYLRITDYAGNVTYISTDGFIFEDTPSTITLTPATTTDPEQPVNNIYSTDVKVKVEVTDAEPYSGIKTVDYWVVMDGDTENPTQSKNLFTFDVENPTHNQLVNTWNGDITVEVDKNNSCDVEVFVKVVDNAGNEDTKSVELDIDKTKPTIDVSFDNNTDNGGNGYFTDARIATVVITERTHHFDAEKATEGIKITVEDASGKTVENAYSISDWTSVEGATADDATHTATITFTEDANYKWEIAYEDEVGNPNEEVNTGDSVAPFEFVIDGEAPTGKIIAVATCVDKDEQEVTRTEEWDELRTEDFKFGFWANGAITLTGEYSDGTSTEMAKVEYFKDVVTEEHPIKTPLTEAQLDEITTWTAFEELKVEEDEQFVVYLKITDPAGNYRYICTNGLIVDHEKPVEETIAPEITTTPITQPLNDIYREDVTVAVKVVEPVKGDTYSGLKSVGYKVLNMGTETQNGVLYTFEVEEPTQDDLESLYEKQDAFVVEAAKNNSNEVKLVVFAEDNAGNYSEDEVTIMIDTTAPTIEVTYNNNTADNAKYFNADRTATITITERNFKAEDVRVTVTNTDGVIPGVSGWSKLDGGGNGDNTKWTGTITYSADGDYTFNISYTDLAGLAASAPQYGGSVAPTDFTIDKTLPVVSVSYDNNSAENDKYFNATRTAEVKIIEHNFDVNRVEFNFNVNGAGGPQPTVAWRDEGDTHTAVLSYTADGDYTFDVVTVQDMAANNFESVDYGNSVAAQDFTVDTDVEMPVISNVINNKPYGYDEEIKPIVEVNDINYDRSEVHLYRTSMADIGVEVELDQIAGGATGGSREYDIFKKDAEGKYDREMEGIYRMTATVWDKAGNESEEAQVVFSINRFGSVYVYDEYLIGLIANGGTYQREIEQDLIITEYNVTKLVEGSSEVEITRDGKPMEDMIAPTIVELEPSDDRGWYEYQYTISKDNFDAEGTYKVVVSSKDDANNMTENDMGILFYVDKEAPEFTRISGLDAAIVDATELKIDYSVYDAIGLQSIVVKVNGEQYGETITDFGDDINNYSGSIVLAESTNAQSVQLIVTDLSGRVTDTSSEEFQQQFYEDFEKEFVSSVTVTTNAFVRFYANKPLFWGSIGGGTATIAAAGAAIAFFRRRKLKASSK